MKGLFWLEPDLSPTEGGGCSPGGRRSEGATSHGNTRHTYPGLSLWMDLEFCKRLVKVKQDVSQYSVAWREIPSSTVQNSTKSFIESGEFLHLNIKAVSFWNIHALILNWGQVSFKVLCCFLLFFFFLTYINVINVTWNLFLCCKNITALLFIYLFIYPNFCTFCFSPSY